MPSYTPSTHLREINTECIHVETIEETCKGFAKSCKALMHELKVHHVGLQIGHGIRQLCKGRFKGVERKGRISLASAACRVAK